MKRISLILAISIMAIGFFSCGQKTDKKADSTVEVAPVEKAKVMVYYFHSKQRCKTCLAIQNLAAETIAANFSQNEDVKFLELDFSEKANEAISEKYEVAGSSLVVVSGEAHTNLTELAFANALRNPDVLKNAIIDEVNTLLTK
jgi:hypothetical protein